MFYLQKQNPKNAAKLLNSYANVLNLINTEFNVNSSLYVDIPDKKGVFLNLWQLCKLLDARLAADLSIENINTNTEWLKFIASNVDDLIHYSSSSSSSLEGTLERITDCLIEMLAGGEINPPTPP